VLLHQCLQPAHPARIRFGSSRRARRHWLQWYDGRAGTLPVDVGGEPIARIQQILFADDVVPVEDTAGFVPGQHHGDAFGDAGPDQIAGGRAPAVVEMLAGQARESTGAVPAFPEVDNRMTVLVVEARVHADVVEVRYRGELVQTMPRLRGEEEYRVDYRHVVGWLVRKPGAFARYRYREDLFPSVTFRRAYDALQTTHGERADWSICASCTWPPSAVRPASRYAFPRR
jgi:hypothetical protein